MVLGHGVPPCRETPLTNHPQSEANYTRRAPRNTLQISFLRPQPGLWQRPCISFPPSSKGCLRQRQTSREAGTQSYGSGVVPDGRATEERGGLTPSSGEGPIQVFRENVMDCRGGVITIFKRAALLALTAVMCVTFGSSAAVAEPRRNLERGIIVDLPGVDAVLYEVTENMYLLDGAGNVVGPEQAVSRKAQASLVGWARLGSPLCPAKQMVTKGVHFKTCAITADGLDNISLATGRGTVDGSFAVV